MLFPKKVAHRKSQTGRKSEKRRMRPDTRGITVAFGAFGLRAITDSRVRSNQIEAARRVIQRTIGKTGQVWIRIFPDKPITRKAAEVPMGSGKGDLDHYVFEVRPGRILFEVDGVPEDIARKALRKAVAKLPVKAKVVAREENAA
ncbi:50S ribosomal protein L16 [Candidatus Kaiserbacteria bacterium RIFCSPHIGHO2_02_FULL_49_34]|uniref:Large ribosomal subunit protein uL16 n=1 Tax=Candidatus Kaiserbacteria bacterium RIFCSPHIGHO2_02_FULL_49_34 TaxID=1798491 RepID=A0A1F6DMX2_9BACT|nr:MAG: 50S ribosomal protein L16 [Candidatus Kaiserbacteria bacterium RIFCSPHIGHO2_02_FULL_49_34]